MSASTLWTDPTSQPLTGAEPGVRMVAGKPYIFDGGALGDHRARIAVETAPANVARLSDDDLKALRRHASRVDYMRPYDRALGDTASDLRKRVWAVLSARGWNTDGSRDVVADDQKAAA